MKKILIGLGGVIVLLIAAVLVAPALIPVSTYKSRLLAEIKQATGRAARIDGDLRFSLLPRPEFVAGKLALANAPDRRPAEMVTVGRLSARVALLPLLSGRLVIDSLVLDKPVIALSVDRNGEPNWRFGKGPAAATASAPQAGGVPAMLKRLTLGDVRLTDGTLTYIDARTGAHYAIHALRTTLSLPPPSRPLRAGGSFVWRRERVSYRLHIARPEALLAGEPTAVDAGLRAPLLKLTFRGTVAADKGPAARGALAVESPSLRRLAAWAGHPLATPGTGFGKFKLAGAAEIHGADLVLRKAAVSLDAVTAKGEARFNGGGPRPYLQATLALDRLDLNPYLPAAPAPAAPADKATAKATGRSTAPIDLAPLRRADADLDLSLGALTIGKIKLGKTHLALSLKDGRLVADLRDMAAYGGDGQARVTLDGSARTPRFALDARLAGFRLNPFLADASGMTQLEGTAKASVNVTGSGPSPHAIVASLAGAGKFAVRNGAIRGLALADLFRDGKGAFDINAGEPEKLDFAELDGSYTIRKGILSNNDLVIKLPMLKIRGRGTVDLARRTVDYRITPRLVGAMAGLGGHSPLARMTVPILVSGRWDKLQFRPDLAAALAGAAKGKALQELQKAIPGGKGPLPGFSGPDLSGNASPQKPENPADIMKRLFGR